MKRLSLVLFLIFSSYSSMAMDSSVFKDTYPGFHNYQLSTFAQLRNYFEALPLNSLNYTDIDHTRIYKMRDHLTGQMRTLYSKIIREKKENTLSERVIYFLENGQSLEYEVLKKGPHVLNTDDFDLLTFRFKTNALDEFYQISIPTFNILMTHVLNAHGEKDFFNLGFMEFNVQIESLFTKNKAVLTYLYFYKEMPNPQSSLSVQAIEMPDSWGAIQFIHLSSQAGEVTPKQFFQGLASGAAAFNGASKAIFKMLLGLGFPDLE